MDIISERILALNAHDLERFLSFYSPHAITEDGENNLLTEGIEQLREAYKHYFEKNPDVHCQLVNRITMGEYTIDQYQVTGLVDDSYPDAIVNILRIVNGKIVHQRLIS